MSTSEMIDTYDDDGAPLGPRTRAEVHREGLWHHVFHAVVVRGDHPSSELILQRRSHTKAAFPGLLDLSATGHLMAGETPADGLRELSEEIGVEARFDQLVELPQHRIVDVDPRAEGNNREIVHAFMLRDDRPLDRYTPDPIEVTGVVAVGLTDLAALFAGRVDRCDGAEQPVDGSEHRIEIGVADLVPDVDGYWPATLAATIAAVNARER